MASRSITLTVKLDTTALVAQLETLLDAVKALDPEGVSTLTNSATYTAEDNARALLELKRETGRDLGLA